MARFLKDRSKVKGLTPGSLVLLGNQKMDKPIIRMMNFDSDDLIEKELGTFEEGLSYVNNKSVTWINIFGIHDLELMKTIGDKLNLPSLLLENILNTDLRPKFEKGDKYNAFILKMLDLEDDTELIAAEQITILLFNNLVVTLQERVGDVFESLRERIRGIKAKVRLNNSDYLTYALMDIIVDNYTILIGNIGYQVENLEDRIFNSKNIDTVEDIYKYKVELNYIRKAIRPMKDIMAMLIKHEDSLFKEDNRKYLEDINEMMMHATDALELYNNMLSDQLNIYNSNMSNRMNEVMKVLTIFASIFIPLSFLAGIYGMNFKFMPELSLKWAYPVFWLVIITVIVSLVIFFRKKRWL
ncbi:MAG: magnesium/cobalt transporter CorA [Marinilabiliaceae bacterium]|jgi:magnesium transporter|nr:magnesium/cobalt transporter CorA [Marinilabiliaceae bacterium]